MRGGYLTPLIVF